tara:strand:- start:11 stop:1066 length:1056 start_codon:yes stop_codon:yes gene_type:complete
MYLANGAAGSLVSTNNPLPVTLGSQNITITGNTFIVDTVTVASSPQNPVHTHITEVGTSGNLQISYLPVGGNVNVTNIVSVTGNLTVNGTVSIGNSTIAVTQGGTWNVTPVATTVNNAPWNIQVARGLVPGATAVNLFGFNDSVTTAFIPIWENATTYTFPASALTMTLVSTSTSDDTSCKVLISGLNSAWVPITEVVTLNGTGNVTTSNQFLRINSMALTQPGSGQVGNVGTITAKNNGTIYGQINPTISRMQNSWYSVPAGKTFYVSRINAFSGDAAGASKYTETRVDVKNNVSGVNYILVQLGWVNNYEVVRDNYQPYTEKSDVRWEARMSQGTYSCAFVVQGIVIDN